LAIIGVMRVTFMRDFSHIPLQSNIPRLPEISGRPIISPQNGFDQKGQISIPPKPPTKPQFSTGMSLFKNPTFS
jgi:hypothetical protein